jgi:hypothetical protein
MKKRSLSFVSGLVLSTAVIASILVAPAAAKNKPPPPPPSASSTYVKSYADVLDGGRCGVTPEDVQATSDGGSIALAQSDCRSVSWLVKSDSAGTPQWQEEVGCFNLPPGGYALGTAVQQTSDGGYVIGGGTRDCDYSPICPYLTSQQCGLIVKLDASGNLACHVFTRRDGTPSSGGSGRRATVASSRWARSSTPTRTSARSSSSSTAGARCSGIQPSARRGARTQS